MTVTDADGRTTTTTYDDAGRPTEVTRADGSSTRWAYDRTGQVTRYTDAAGSVTTYTYDSAGRRASAKDPSGRTTSYGYDEAGNLVTVTQPGGGTTTHAYDAAGRRTATDYSDSTPDVSWSYDLAGRTVAVADGTGTTTYSHDVVGRVTGVDGPTGDVGYAWDAVGRLTELTYPSGSAVTYGYDDASRLTQVMDWQGREFGYSWTADGQVDSLTYPNGVVTDYAHDEAGQVLGIETQDAASADLLQLGYAYSEAGLLTDQSAARSAESRAPPVAPTTTSTVAWDPQARIAQITGDLGGVFDYDDAGSPTTLPGGRALAYDSARQLASLTTAGLDGQPPVTTSFTYDDRGNRAAATTGTATTAHAYDLANRLTDVTAPDGTTTAYTYSATSLRATARTGVGDEAITEAYTWDTTRSVPTLLVDGDHAYLYGVGSAPLAQIDLADDARIDYLHGDTIGSIRMVTDASGDVLADADYDAYGLVHEPTSDPVAGVTRFGYAGEYTDPTGYIYLRNRYYDPRTAAFLTVDPLVDSTLNPYGYTDGNPLQFTDPLGLFPSDWGSLAAGIINVVWGTVKVAQGGAIVLLGATATITGVGAVPGAAGTAVGAYHIGSGTLKTLRGARQITTALNSEPIGASCEPHNWKGNTVRLVWGVIPFGGFFDKNTDWLDGWGSLP